MSRTATLVLQRNPPSLLNAMLRQHWTKRRSERQMWADEVVTAWLGAGRPVFQRPRIEIVCYYRTNRRRDPDGITGSVKPILDGLVRAGCIPDDNDGVIDLDVRGEYDKRRARVEVTLEERDGT